MYQVPSSAFRDGRQGRSEAQAFATILHEFYGELLEQGVPDHLAALVRRLDDSSARPGAGRKLALVVEADAESRSHATLLLEQTGLTVVECTDAEAALTQLREHGPDVAFIFADEVLAGEPDGCELALAASAWPSLHMILTTQMVGGRPDCLPANVITMPKPWRGLDLVIEAGRALARASAAA